MVAVWEFADNRMAMKAAVLNTSIGHVQITTMPAVTRNGWKKILQETVGKRKSLSQPTPQSLPLLQMDETGYCYIREAECRSRESPRRRLGGVRMLVAHVLRFMGGLGNLAYELFVVDDLVKRLVCRRSKMGMPHV